MEACDKISDTARAHHRAFVVEVMGRQSGYLAMAGGVAAALGGAARVISVDGEWAEIGCESSADVASGAAPENLHFFDPQTELAIR